MALSYAATRCPHFRHCRRVFAAVFICRCRDAYAILRRIDFTACLLRRYDTSVFAPLISLYMLFAYAARRRYYAFRRCAASPRRYRRRI